MEYNMAVSNQPQCCGNSCAISDHTVLPDTW